MTADTESFGNDVGSLKRAFRITALNAAQYRFRSLESSLRLIVDDYGFPPFWTYGD